MNKSLSIKTIT